ncbi:Heterokaryon incompatibility domain-containing protein [Madurella fahalii]|uniref:Heterokaryon incompatibility domain-containing protein n=1 Tax=Madurella fahalii TaxID=1157608 RepID=A0ABQ0G444_9PEZI
MSRRGSVSRPATVTHHHGLHQRRDSMLSDVTADTGWSGDDDEGSILEAVERAKVFRLCLRRIWAVSASLSNRARSLPSLIPAVGTFSVPSHSRQHHEHEQCTFDFCEHSRIDFTSVAQRHEGCQGSDCSYYDFPLGQLTARVDRGKSTAWKLVSGLPDDVPSLLEPTQPYMAISHVWADGTGAGIWSPGKVNRCLYEFFCEIAREFQCEGCWWDAISIPRDDEARSKALNVMHSNYADARITLVHDLYLREWEWVDAPTACFAIVMSPWYSRGWTALELAKSHKVKILFKARNDRYLIKDLDIDILAQVSQTSPHYPTAKAISKLRSAKIQSLGDLLSILAPRDTSKPRDIPIISGLLAGVDVSGGLTQQEIYQRILRKLGRVAQGHLFHNSATMAAPGFSWCPTNILDIPMAAMEPDSVLLELRENGDLEGTWKAYSVDSIPTGDFIWQSTHDLTHVALKLALSHENKDKHILLVETPSLEHRALLVRPMTYDENTTDVIYCRFVGPVYFRSALGSGFPLNTFEGRVINVRISNSQKMQEIRSDAWEYVRDTIEQHEETSDETETTGRDQGRALDTIPEEDESSSQDPKALLFFGSEVDLETRQSLFESDSARFPPTTSSSKSSDNMVMFRLLEQNSDVSSTSVKAFFYGDEIIIKSVREWLRSDEVMPGKMMLLHSDWQIKVDSSERPAQGVTLGGQALRLLAEEGKEKGLGALVMLLLDSGAPYLENSKGQWPIHSAVENADINIVQSMLTNKTNPADLNKENANRQRAIHVAAEHNRVDIAGLLVEQERMGQESLDAQDGDGQTALIVAAKMGRCEIAELLLDKGADATVRDFTALNHIALHYAAQNGHLECISALLKHAEVECQKEAARRRSGPAHSVSTENTDGTELGRRNDSGNPSGEGDDTKQTEKAKQMLAEKANLNLPNGEGMTALHLASQYGHSDVVKTLVEHGAQLSARDSKGQTALMLAIKHGNAQTVDQLLQGQARGMDQEDQMGLDIALLSAVANLGFEDRGKGYPVVHKLLAGGAMSGYPDPSDGMTALHWAVKDKDKEIAEMLIKDMKQGDKRLDHKEKKKGQSALVMAVECGWNEIAMALLSKGADAKSKDLKGKTILHWSAVRRNLELVQELLKMKDTASSLMNEQDAQQRTALHLATQSGEANITTALLEERANPFTKDAYGRSALMLAAAMGRVDTVKRLINLSDLGVEDASGRTALDLAAARGYSEVVVALLGSPSIKDDMANKALKLAAEEGHVPVAITIYDRIKSVKLRESAAHTILLSAAAGASTPASVVDTLMKIVVDINYRNGDRQTALMLAVVNSQQLLFRKLLELGADLDLQDGQKRTALMMAIEKNDLECVDSLLDANADPNIHDEQGYTALHYAAESGEPRMIRLLLNSGWDLLRPVELDAVDNHGRTALHIALEKLPMRQQGLPVPYQQRGVRLVWQYLIRYGARLNIQDEEGQTPLHRAVRRNQIDTVDVLFRFAKMGTGDWSHLDAKDGKERTPLLLAAERGFWDLVVILVDTYNFDPNTQDDMDRTPLLLAAAGGDKKSVSSLLGKNANPNLSDKKFRTPLLEAARNGHESIVDLLLQGRKAATSMPHGRDKTEKANVNARDDMGRTALMLAAENGQAGVVTYLLDNQADPSLVDNEGKKAWQRAMDKGHAAVVDTLLSQSDAPNQDLTAVNGALLLASRKGWTKLVEVLLKQEADVTFRSDDSGSTALHLAAMGGHVEVVKRLLKKGVDVATKDAKDRTALMVATEHGFESIVQVLLEQPEIKKDIKNWMGPEALHCAAEKGNARIVKRLLTTDVDLNASDAAARTAMTLAAANGSREIVDLLLQRGADPTLKDTQNRTALHYAAWGGHGDVAESLLDKEADLNAPDNGKQAPLHLAAERASTKVVELLLVRGANPNARSSDGQTALHRAAWGGSRDVVKLLRKKGADPSARDRWNNKPWQVAAEKGHESIVETLLEVEESIEDDMICRKRGLIFTSQKGYTAMAKALLNKRADAMVKDSEGLTPLHWAAKRGDYAMVELLVRSQGPGKTLDIPDNQRRTPLCLAVLNDRAAVVRLLIKNGAGPNTRDDKGQTVLHIAAEKGFGEIVQILDEHDADPHARNDHQKQKAWFLAAEAGHHQIVRLLLKREVDFNPQSQKIEELFLRMADKGFVLMVKLLLDNHVNKDATDQLGRTALGLAAEKEREDVVEHLLRGEAKPSVPDANLQTPLLWAAKSGNPRIMKLLLDSITSTKSSSSDRPEPPSAGGSVRSQEPADMLNHADSQGRTALLLAIQYDNDEAVRLLLEKSGGDDMNLDLKDSTGKAALHLAAQMGKENLVEELVQRNADRTVQDMLDRTPLFLAVQHGREKVVDVLLVPRSLNKPDVHGRTPLHVAAERGYLNIVKKLLGHGAERDNRDHQGRTPLLLAAENGEKEVVDLLLTQRARQDIGDRNERTPLLLAVANGDYAIVKSLLNHPWADVMTPGENGQSLLLNLAVKSGNKDVAWLVAEQLTRMQGAKNRHEADIRTPNSTTEAPIPDSHSRDP